MGTLDHQSRLIDVMYLSATQPQAIGELASELHRVTRANVTGTTVHNFVSNRGHIPTLIGAPVDATAIYQQRYSSDNIWFLRIPPLQTGSVLVTDDYVGLAELKQTSFWREYVSLLDIAHGAGICGLRDQGSIVMLNLYYPQGGGPCAGDDLELFKRLGPHWVNTCAIQNKLGMLQDTAATLSSALDRVTLAVAFIDARGKVCRINAGMEQLCRNGNIVAVNRGRLQARDSGDARRLDKAIASAILPVENSTTSPSTERLLLHDGTALLAAFASVHALGCAATQTQGISNAAAIVFIRPLAVANTHDLAQALSELFGLTAAEAEFAVQLHQHCDLTLAANALGTRVDSARTRLKLIFDKTGVHGQPALIRLIDNLGNL